MALRIYTRKEWGARPARPMTTHGAPVEAFIHHTADKNGHFPNLAAQQRKMRDIQSFHMNGQGWSDIGYHYLVFQPQGDDDNARARAFQGRLVQFTPAAQAGHNSNTLAISVVGNGESEAMARNTRFVIEQILRRYPSLRAIGGHRDVVSTSCPGAKFYFAISQIARAADLQRVS